MVICNSGESRIIDVVRQYYVKIIAQCFSSDERRFAVADSSGRIITFPVPQNATTFTISRWTSRSVVPLCLASFNDYLICGCYDGCLRLLSWSALSTYSPKQNEKPSATECLKVSESEISAVLPLSLNNDAQIILGCSDGAIKMLDLETKKIVSSFDGHAEQINKLVNRRSQAKHDVQSSQFISCSNDGTVKLWDARAGIQPTRTLHVRNSKQIRSNFPRGIYALDVDDDFVVCGGGVSLGMWHLSSESLVTTLEESISQPMIYFTTELSGGRVLAGGRELTPDLSRLQTFDYTGAHVLSVPLHGIFSIRSISSMSVAPKKGDRLTLLSGESPEIFCLNESGFLLHSINIEND